MRAYFFVNTALSGIQKGLQVAHCVAEFFANFEDEAGHDLTGTNLLHWAACHKTIIVLEGGFHQDLQEIEALLHDGDFGRGYFASFTEDAETMNGMMTAVGIILPERIYEAAKILRDRKTDMDRWVKLEESNPHFCRKVGFPGKIEEYTEWEAELIHLLNSCPFAR